jgi:hypothetical protein
MKITDLHEIGLVLVNNTHIEDASVTGLVRKKSYMGIRSTLQRADAKNKEPSVLKFGYCECFP